jgi:hypothetical protein
MTLPCGIREIRGDYAGDVNTLQRRKEYHLNPLLHYEVQTLSSVFFCSVLHESGVPQELLSARQLYSSEVERAFY